MNMYLRWMVRPNDRGVDLGLWKKIKPAELMVPLDVHTGRVGRELGLLERTQDDWKAVWNSPPVCVTSTQWTL